MPAVAVSLFHDIACRSKASNAPLHNCDCSRTYRICSNIRQLIQSTQLNGPARTFGSLHPAVGEMWQAASDAEKAPYIALSDADKERYHSELAAYKQRYRIWIHDREESKPWYFYEC